MAKSLALGLAAASLPLLVLSQQNTPGGLYFHVPRGSNNRVNEKTAAVNNPNRLFFSNNNARGGYNVGELPSNEYQNQDQQYQMQWFMSESNDKSDGKDSFLEIEWGQLQGCGADAQGDKVHKCETKIEMMCQDALSETNDNVNALNDALRLRNGKNKDSALNFQYEKKYLPDPNGACYRDDGRRDLNGRMFNIPRARQRNPVPIKDWCKTQCANSGFDYFGLQAGRQCFCGNSFGKYGRVDDSACNRKCHNPEDDIDYKCGGNWLNNVYLTERHVNLDPENRNQKNQRRQQSINNDAGIHESWEYYDRCKDHRPGFSSNFETRSGFECFSERQEMWYNEATPWLDVAYFVDDQDVDDLCTGFTSPDTYPGWVPKGECVEVYSGTIRKHKSHLSEAECGQNNDNNGVWMYFYDKWTQKIFDDENGNEIASEVQCLAQQSRFPDEKLVWGRPLDWQDLANDVTSAEQCLILAPLPTCEAVRRTRANIISNDDDTYGRTDPHGGSEPAQMPRYKWRIPKFQQDKRCVMRIRQFIRAAAKPFPLTEATRKMEINGQPLTIAMPQYMSRGGQVVFQDRTHVFNLVNRPSSFKTNSDFSGVIHNLVIRGKRGNIVQTFPAVEYDFSPNRLYMNNNDAVHIQWTGSNSHDNDGNSDGQAGDDGEGQGGTDRNNFMQLLHFKENFPIPYEYANFFKDVKTVLWVPSDEANPNFMDLSLDQQVFDLELAFMSGGYYWCRYQQDCDNSVQSKQQIQERMDNTSPTFKGAVFVPKNDQTTFYMSMRNNNFSNRSQKGRIFVGQQPELKEGEYVPTIDHAMTETCGKTMYYNQYTDPTLN